MLFMRLTGHIKHVTCDTPVAMAAVRYTANGMTATTRHHPPEDS